MHNIIFNIQKTTASCQEKTVKILQITKEECNVSNGFDNQELCL